MIRGERDLNTYDLLHNQAAFVFKTKGAAKAKDPLNIHLLNLLMDRIHDVKISHRVSSPDMERMVRGSDHRDVSSEEKIGPGRYDVNRSHSYLDKTDRGAIDFGLSKSCRSSLIRTSSYNENSSVYSHLEGTSPARPHTGMPSSSSSLVKAGSTSRSSTSSSGPRRSGFGSGVSRSQIQRSFSSDAAGMGLDPEWDKRPLPYGAFSKSVLVKKKETNASSFTERSDVDCGKKTSLATSVRLSHRAYSAAFRSKSPSGLHIPPPTSGDIGPGCFPGAEVSSISIKYPDCASPAFMGRKRVPPRLPAAENLNELKPFSEQNSRGFLISKTGAYPGRAHKLEWTKSKVCKIYPKLAKALFRTEEC